MINYNQNRKYEFMAVMSQLILLVGTLVVSGCGSSDPAPASSSSSTPSSVSGLPKTTGPVVASSSATRNKSGTFSNIGPRAATTGETFATAASTTWTSGHSRAFCESINILRDFFNEAAQPDKILCYIGVMQSNSLFASNVDNGSYHYYSLVESGQPLGKVKFKIVKGSDGSITSFEMFTCFGSSGTVQDSYVSQSISASSTSVVSKAVGTEDRGSGVTGSYGGSLTATGSINSSGQWISKSLNGTRSYNETGGSNNSSFGVSGTITQADTTVTISGYRYGNRFSGTAKDAFSDAFYTVAQVVNDSNMSSFALGDGSSQMDMNYSYDSNNDGDTADAGDFTYAPGTTLTSWNGDTRATLGDVSTGDHYTTANNGSLPTPQAVSAVSFTADQTWDCQADSGGFQTATISDAINSVMNTSCDNVYGTNRNWIECNQAQ